LSVSKTDNARSLATDRLRLHDSAPDLYAVVPEQSLLGESARMRACPPSR
jgi:hypothetical protein